MNFLDVQSSEIVLDSDEDLSAQHLIDFSPIYRCLHIYTVLASRDVFENYYRTQREKQARLVVQPPYSKVRIIHSYCLFNSDLYLFYFYRLQLETVQQYRHYLQSVVGLFVQEDHILNTSSGLIDKTYVNELWNTSLSKIISTLKSHTVQYIDVTL